MPILQSNRYPSTTKRLTQPSVYPAISLSTRTMSNSLYHPVIEVAANNLWVSRQDVKRNAQLGRVEFSDKVEQFFADAYALIIGKNHQPCHAKIACFHVDMYDGDKCDWPALIDCSVTASKRS
jgi:hypothetical protein